MHDATTRPVDRLLERLEAVRPTGPDCWIARCPAHDDRNPSLNIREKPDGMLLVHCKAGCASADIVAAAGLSLADLFPRDDAYPDAPRRHRRPAWPAADILRCLATEGTILALASADLKAGKTLSDADTARLLLAAGRWCDAADLMEND